MHALETQILHHLPVGIWVARAPSGEFVYANDAFRTILGTGPVAGVGIEGAPAAYAIYDAAGNLFPVAELPFSRALASGGPATVDHLVIHRSDGRQVHVRAFATPLRDSAGVIEFIIVAFFDITAEAAAVDQRELAQRRLAFALKNAPLILFAVDRQGVITLSEGAALARLGFAPGQVVGRPLLDIYGGSVAPQLFHRALRGEAVTDTVDLGGTVLDVFLSPVRDARGELDGFIGLGADVTEQRQLQATAIQDDRLKAMGTLAASVAHEINNPLAYIVGSLDQLDLQLVQLRQSVIGTGSGAGVDVGAINAGIERMAQIMSAMRGGAERVQEVARDLRSFGRPDSEGVTAIDVRTVVQSVLQLTRKEIEARATLVVALHDVPPVQANEARLVQVVLNLLVNAWQALPDPDPLHHRIDLTVYADGAWVVIEIADSGTGIDPQILSRLFEPFVTNKEIGRGTGLGLFVCRNIVRAFGGEISVHNREGRAGARFRVRLPAMAARLPAARAASASVPTAGAGSGAAAAGPPRPPSAGPRRPRVMVIDDDELVAGVLVHSLKAEFDAWAIYDAQEALAVLLDDPDVDLVFCDLMMKGLTGMDIHEQISQRAPHRLAKLVFMTGGAFTARAAAFIDQVSDAVVYKPFSVVAEARRRLGMPDSESSPRG